MLKDFSPSKIQSKSEFFFVFVNHLKRHANCSGKLFFFGTWMHVQHHGQLLHKLEWVINEESKTSFIRSTLLQVFSEVVCD